MARNLPPRADTTPRRSSDRLAGHLAPPTKRELEARRALATPGLVYGYCRVSTTRQADEGESLDVQQRQIEGYAHMQGLALDRVFIERGVSGAKPLAERPEGAALLALLKPGDAVITPKLDRMFRSALDALDVLGRLKAGGVSLHMIDLGGDTTSNGVSKLVFTILVRGRRGGARPHPRAHRQRQARPEEPGPLSRRRHPVRLDQGRRRRAG